jgi:radical SAM family uncharacterized protein
MLNPSLKELIARRVLPRVQTPGQYLGGELNAVVKDHRQGRGRLCLAFPDTYAIGMSNHAVQVLYHLMNRLDDWACERVFAPWTDMEQLLREHGLPLFSLETYTPLPCFDVLGFSLQHELCYTNVLTMLDLAGIPLAAEDRALEHPLVIAGGPCVANPEPMARFIDAFAIGDGEETLPRVCGEWLGLKGRGGDRAALLAELARRVPSLYVPSCYQPDGDAQGRAGPPRPLGPHVPARVAPAVVADLDAVPLPTRPVVPTVECVQDRISIEIMRGCPWRCRFCQSATTKRPVRFRRVDSIVRGAVESYRGTGLNEISLLSLSTGDYPHFRELMQRLREVFRPLGVSLSVPSLRVNQQLADVSQLLETERHSGLTLAPEAALDDMRQRIGKPIRNEDLLAGCRAAFEKGFGRVKLYFMCGLPGERPDDLDGIIDMAETISRLGKEVRGRFATVVANGSNFVPQPQTPFQWEAMQTREYFQQAHRRLRQRRRLRSVELKCHDIECSLLEGVFCRGDRRLGAAVELAWRRGARFDSWSDKFQPALWREVLAEAGTDVDAILHRPYPLDAPLPWDHIGIRQGRAYLEKEQRAVGRG